MRRAAPLLVLLTLALVPGGIAHAQTGSPQVVEPKPGEAIPQTTPSTQSGVTGPDAPVTSGATGVTGQAGNAQGTTGAAGAKDAAAQDSSNDDALLIAAIALGALLLFILIVTLLWRVRGWNPRWLRRWRHANAEAAWRLGLGWEEFRDFLRLGR
jgi:hypothetical protein